MINFHIKVCFQVLLLYKACGGSRGSSLKSNKFSQVGLISLVFVISEDYKFENEINLKPLTHLWRFSVCDSSDSTSRKPPVHVKSQRNTPESLTANGQLKCWQWSYKCGVKYLVFLHWKTKRTMSLKVLYIVFQICLIFICSYL